MIYIIANIFFLTYDKTFPYYLLFLDGLSLCQFLNTERATLQFQKNKEYESGAGQNTPATNKGGLGRVLIGIVKN